MGGLGELILFLLVAGVVAVVGVRLGMLLAPHLARLTKPSDEDDGGIDE